MEKEQLQPNAVPEEVGPVAENAAETSESQAEELFGESDYLNSFFSDEPDAQEESESMSHAYSKAEEVTARLYQDTVKEAEEQTVKTEAAAGPAAEKPKETAPSAMPSLKPLKKAKSGKSSGKKDIAEEELPEKPKTWRIITGVLVWAKDILIALLVVWFIITFVAQNCVVDGTSMVPTLENNDRLIVNKFIYRFTEPQRGDIIVFNWHDPVKDEDERLVKRIIGMPGDTIEFIDGEVYINGQRYDESKYLEGKFYKTGDIKGAYTVPAGSYFVMGDNRDNSKDSRYSVVGAIPKSSIVGKASFRYWPLKKLSVVE